MLTRLSRRASTSTGHEGPVVKDRHASALRRAGEKGGGATMMRFICQKCLRLWDGEQVSHTASCPYCGGGLNAR